MAQTKSYKYTGTGSGSNKKKVVVIIVITALVVAALGFAAFKVFRKTDTSTPTGTDTINLEPATEQDKQEADQNKDRIVEEQKQSANTGTSQTSNKKQVNVVITNAATDSINAYVTGVFEENGTCTATFTQGSTSVTRTSNGFQNVSYTQCAPITPNLPSGGSWSVVVSYSSSTAEGKSQAQSLWGII